MPLSDDNKGANADGIRNNEILYVLLPDYAGHEIVYLSEAVASDESALKANPKYINKVVAPTLEPVKSIGGFRTLPDYSFETMPEDYAAIVLIGGFGWATPVAEKVVPILRKARLSELYAMPPRLWQNMVFLTVSGIQATDWNS